MIAAKTSRRIEIITGLVVMAGGIAGFIAVPYMVAGWAFAIPGLTDASLSPTFFPRVGMTALALAGLGVILSVGERSDVLPFVAMTREEWKRAFLAGGNIVLYALLLPLFGFLASSALFIFGMAVTAGYRRMLVIVTTAILFPVITIYVFRLGLKVLLPSGTIM